MMMRKIELTTGEIYHVFNRGVAKKEILKDDRDRIRFLFLIIYNQSPLTFHNLNRYVSYFVKHQVFNISADEMKEIAAERLVSLLGFTLMPNHFHLLLKQEQDGGISRYMQKISDSIAKYFNTKYHETGHLFQGPFKATHIDSNDQLLYVSAYIHRNPRELSDWKNKEQEYPWSSYRDYIKKSRWGRLLERGILLEQFDNPEDYHRFVVENPAKEKEWEC